MNILIVDDHEINRKLLRLRLEEENVEVIEAVDGKEALGLLDHQHVDAIVSDILMPRMDGYEFCRRIRNEERFDAIPFIFYTATYTTREDEKLAMNMGGNVFVRKPAQASEIFVAIASAREEMSKKEVSRPAQLGENILREYNERLIAKLEHKNTELEDLFKEHNDLLRHLQLQFERMPIGYMVLDPALKVIEWNPACEKIFGYTRNETLGKNVVELILSPSNKQFVENFIHDLEQQQETLVAVNENMTKDGRTILCEWYDTPLRNEKGECIGVMGMVQDITERKRAEQALQESEEIFRQLTGAIKEVFWLTNTEKNDMVYISPGYEKIWGRTRESLFANPKAWLDSIHPVDRERVLANAISKQVSGDYDEEYRISLPDGSIRWIHDRAFPIHNERGEVHRIAGVAEDITERKYSEELLRDSEKRYRDIVTWAPVGIYQSRPEGKFMMVNKYMIDMLGYESEKELLRINIEEIYLRKDERKELISKYEPAGSVVNLEVQWKRKDGIVIWVQLASHAIKDENGATVYFEGFVHDITSKKALESQLLRAQRMESIGTLAGGIAHDLNNVLAPILMAIEMLKGRHRDGTSQSYLSTLESSALRGSSIVKQLLTFARGAEGDRVPIQLKLLIREIETMIRQTFPKSIYFSSSIVGDLPALNGDPTQLQQVLLNLCVNARDAMPAGGRLTITVEEKTMDEQYAAMTLGGKPGDYVVITVADSGTGIPQDILNKIFDPFFTTKEVGKGTGLGLSMALGIVKDHGGFINVSSEPGKGTSFHVFLPAQETKQSHPAPTQELELSCGNGELILIVDDEISICDITKGALESNGYTVLTAHDGTEAVTKYVEHPDEIQLVLTDMAMPIMDGYATVRALRKLNPGIKIICASGLANSIDPTKIAQLNVNATLTKPFTTLELLTAIRNVINGNKA